MLAGYHSVPDLRIELQRGKLFSSHKLQLDQINICFP